MLIRLGICNSSAALPNDMGIYFESSISILASLSLLGYLHRYVPQKRNYYRTVIPRRWLKMVHRHIKDLRFLKLNSGTSRGEARGTGLTSVAWQCAVRCAYRCEPVCGFHCLWIAYEHALLLRSHSCSRLLEWAREQAQALSEHEREIILSENTFHLKKQLPKSIQLLNQSITL